MHSKCRILLSLISAAVIFLNALSAAPIEVLGEGEVAQIESGTQVWTDRDYPMTEWPEKFSDYRYFVRSPMRGTRIRVNQPGYIIALTPVSRFSRADQLKADGFEYSDVEPFPPYLLNNRNAGQSCITMQKQVQAGDIIEIGYYGILIWGHAGFPTTDEEPTMIRITIPTIDISQEKHRHVIIAEGTEEVYQGHVDTLLMPDGKTMFAAWSINHAGHLGPLARSEDAGLTWEMIETPENWWRVRQTTPTMHRLVDPEGVERIFVFGGWDFPGRLRQAYSEDGGKTWTPMRDTGLAAECAPKTILSFDDGDRLVMYVDRRDVYSSPREDKDPVIFMSESFDGGLGWTPERVLFGVPTRWAQPAVIRSPDGQRAVMQMRYSGGPGQSPVAVSDDGGKTWSDVRNSHWNASGHRPNMVYSPCGRIVLVFRDTTRESETVGHFVAWVGTFDDLYHQREGQYRIKLMHNYAGWDNAYSGLEVLPDGTIVATNYLKYWDDDRRHSIVSTRFTLAEMDKLLAEKTSEN